MVRKQLSLHLHGGGVCSDYVVVCSIQLSKEYHMEEDEIIDKAIGLAQLVSNFPLVFVGIHE